MEWKAEKVAKVIPQMKDPVLIEGLPGIANVGKIAADFIIEELKPKLLYRFFSYGLPHTVFVNEDNLVDLPKIELYLVKGKKRDILVLSGDVQPIDEVSTFTFCDKVLDIFEELGGKEIITTGGIGLPNEPKEIAVYCTGNSKDMIRRYKKDTKLKDKLYGVVGPIVGVSGLLLGLSEKRRISAIAILAETMGHPMFLGVKGAKEILKVLIKNLGLDLSLSELDTEIKELEQGLKKAGEIIQMKSQGTARDVNYIG